MYETILLEKKDHVAVLTLNRPDKLNAINPQVKKEIYQALTELEADEDVGVAVMTGAGSAFSSGWDMTAGIDAMSIFFGLEEEEKLLHFHKPLIAAVNGYALGEGAQHALLSDIIIASDRAVFAFNGPRVGGMCHVAIWALPRLIGMNRAAEMLFTCNQISAQEAYRIGLVNKVVPHDQLMPAALEVAEEILKSAPLSIRYVKRALRRGLLDDDLKRFLQEGLRATLGSEDAVEAVKAFSEQRAPVFKGR